MRAVLDEQKKTMMWINVTDIIMNIWKLLSIKEIVPILNMSSVD